jgi:hypothetical protein
MVLGFSRPYAHPVGSFVSPVIPPDVEPAEDDKIQVCISIAWLPYVVGALSQLTLQSTWRSDDPNEILLAQQRATYVIDQFNYVPECGGVGTPFWDDATDVDDEEPADDQDWYGVVTNPTAPAGELDFVESVALWIFTGLVAIATFEVGGIAPAIVFHTTVEKFIILQKRGDTAETIRFVIDGQDAKFVNTAPYAEGDIIETKLVTPQTGGDHTLMIIGGSS